MRVVVHVDDFICTGEKENLLWLESELKKHFQLKSELLGPGKNEVKHTTFVAERSLGMNGDLPIALTQNMLKYYSKSGD